jgi:hypothetical protein
MDPSWSSIKIILRRHEDMTKRSRLNYAQVDDKVNQVGNKLNGHEQISFHNGRLCSFIIVGVVIL